MNSLYLRLRVRNYRFPDLVVSLEVYIQDPVERSECHSLHSESISSEVYVETVTHISADITEVSSVLVLQCSAVYCSHIGSCHHSSCRK